MRTKFGIVIAILVIAVIVIGFYFYKHHKIEQSLIKGPAQPVVVSFAKARQVAWAKRIQVVGSISTRVGITVRAQVEGRVVKINYTSGQKVKKGSVMFIIYPYVLEADLRQAKAQVEFTQFLRKRMQKLFKEGAVSKERFISADSQLKLDLARVKALIEQLKLTRSFAPFDGVIGLTHINLNDFVIKGQVLATYQAHDNLRVDFAVPQNFSGQVRVGDSVLVQTDNSDITYHGKIYAINPIVNRNTRMLEMRATIIGQNLLPGMFAEVTVKLKRYQQFVVIPQTAVMHSLHGNYVYKVEQGFPRKVFVKVGEMRGSDVAILKGLQPGNVVVSAGQQKIHAGVKVTDKDAIIVKPKVQNYDGP